MTKVFDVEFACTVNAPDEKTARFYVAALLDGQGGAAEYHGVPLQGCTLQSYGGIRALERTSLRVPRVPGR